MPGNASAPCITTSSQSQCNDCCCSTPYFSPENQATLRKGFVLLAVILHSRTKQTICDFQDNPGSGQTKVPATIVLPGFTTDQLAGKSFRLYAIPTHMYSIRCNLLCTPPFRSSKKIWRAFSSRFPMPASGLVELQRMSRSSQSPSMRTGPGFRISASYTMCLEKIVRSNWRNDRFCCHRSTGI